MLQKLTPHVREHHHAFCVVLEEGNLDLRPPANASSVLSSLCDCGVPTALSQEHAELAFLPNLSGYQRQLELKDALKQRFCELCSQSLKLRKQNGGPQLCVWGPHRVLKKIKFGALGWLSR